MHRFFARFAVPTLFASLIFSTASFCGAQTVAAVQSSARVLGPVDADQTVRLAGHVPEWASGANDKGALDPNSQLSNLHLILTRAPAVEAAFHQLLADQQNPASPRYHQWLTPEQNAAQFGVAPSDLQAVEGWLQARGLSVDSVAGGGVFLSFSGKVSAVNSAFSVNLHSYALGSATRYSVASQPAIPAALGPVVGSIAGLTENVAHSNTISRGVDTLSHKGKAGAAGGVTPSYTNVKQGDYWLTPGDFNVIYDINAATSAGYTGSGYRVAILGDSRIAAADTAAYESVFGLQSTVVSQILVPGQTDPGLQSGGDELEAALDTQRVVGTAAGAGVDLLVLGSLADANIFAGLQYELSTLNDAVVNMSFGGCNVTSSAATEASQYNSYYSALSAQGVSVFVSSGDTGAAGCDSNYTTIPTAQVQAANLLCASAYITCVGGTEFTDTANPLLYFSSTNSATLVSALGYIPEGGWNDPAITTSTGTTTYQAASTGGGPTIATKPSWQTGTGVPADGYRDTPDMSFLGSPQNNPYMICEADVNANCATGYVELVGGTSASAPSMAAVTTLLDQKLGARQGNVNPLLYQLAASANSPFHDVTVATSGVTNCVVTTPSTCNNSTPAASSLTGGLSGFLVTAGYDEVTGLGSLDVNNFLTAAASASGGSFTVTPASTPLYLNNATGATVSTTVTLASVNNFAGTVALSCSVTGASGSVAGTCALSPTSATLAAAGMATSTLTITNASGTATGSLSVTVTGTSGSTIVTSSALSVTITAPSFSISPASTSLSPAAGATSATDVLTLTSIQNFAGSVALTCKVTSTGTATGACAVTSPIALAAGGTGSSTLTINSIAAGTGGGTLSVVVTGTSGVVVVSAPTITVTVTAPSFTITPASTALSFTSGATTGNSTALALGTLGNYAGTIGLTCSITSSTAAFQPTCAVSPTSVALPAGGTGSATLTIGSTTARTTTARGANGSFARGAGGGSMTLGWSLGGGVAFALLMFCTPLRKRRLLSTMTLAGLLTLGLSVLGGCSSGGGTTVLITQSSAGNYTVTVTGTPAAGATTTTAVTTTVSVTIN